MDDLLKRIGRGEILVADGAMGTMLMARGVDIKKGPESVNLSDPALLEDIAKAYLEAGADIVQTNTFGASPLKLAQYGLEDKTEEINRNAVQAVRKAVKDRAYVSASCGPSGRLLKPYGDTDPETVYESFERQLGYIAEAGPDIICVETMTDINEAVMAVRAAKKTAPQIPVMATMTFEETPRGFHTIMGVSVKEAVTKLRDAGANIVGSNCGNGIELMVEVALELRRETDLPLLIQSNAGLPNIVEGKIVYNESPEFMAEKARALVDVGVSIIGGCCGTTPEHIKALRKMVDSL